MRGARRRIFRTASAASRLHRGARRASGVANAKRGQAVSDSSVARVHPQRCPGARMGIEEDALARIVHESKVLLEGSVGAKGAEELGHERGGHC
eukprot:3463509-Alexandrium_andersonii.AAC.1